MHSTKELRVVISFTCFFFLFRSFCLCYWFYFRCTSNICGVMYWLELDHQLKGYKQTHLYQCIMSRGRARQIWWWWWLWWWYRWRWWWNKINSFAVHLSGIHFVLFLVSIFSYFLVLFFCIYFRSRSIEFGWENSHQDMCTCVLRLLNRFGGKFMIRLSLNETGAISGEKESQKKKKTNECDIVNCVEKTNKLTNFCMTTNCTESNESNLTFSINLWRA